MEFILIYFYTAIGAIIAITFHEYTKAFISTSLGDLVPKNKGYLTLNPIKHLEPIGFLLLIAFGIGWGKQTETSALYYKNRKTGLLYTFISPIFVNLFIGAIFAIIYFMIKKQIPAADFAENNITFEYKILINLSYYISKVNIVFAFLNLIPIYPMCGYKILLSFLSSSQSAKYINSEKILQLIFVILGTMGIVSIYTNYFVNLILQRG